MRGLRSGLVASLFVLLPVTLACDVGDLTCNPSEEAKGYEQCGYVNCDSGLTDAPQAILDGLDNSFGFSPPPPVDPARDAAATANKGLPDNYDADPGTYYAGAGCANGAQPCSTDGQFLCFDDAHFGLCNFGCAIPQSVAAGTQCKNGAIQRRDAPSGAPEFEKRGSTLKSLVDSAKLAL